MIGKIISHYKIIDKIGEGGMGVVYKALDTKLDRSVALKFLPPHLATSTVEKERFLHEAKAASALTHPNITVIHEISEAEGQVYISMEYVEGKTLKQMAGKETLPVKKMLEIAIGVCEGLNAAHKRDIVHRDIKSDNIMVTKEGQVKIMDFGLAKLKGATKLTKVGSTVGTAAYMSPEQAQGEEVDQRSDIFSFGVVLYELLTQQLPFKGEHQAALIYSILSEEPQPIARYNNQVSPKLEEMVFKALSKDKEERYQHIDDLLADLRRERKSLEYAKTHQLSKISPPVKPKKRILSFLVPASVLAIAVVLFFVFKPFKLEVSSKQEAQAKENSLAIMYFENVADPEDKEKMAQMVTSLLITDLSESEYMSVVSQQRLYDILKLLGKEDVKSIDKGTASEVAQKAGVKWILTGKVMQAKPNMVVTAEVSEATGGKILAAQRVSGTASEDLFAVVDKLSAEIKKDLALSKEAKKETDKPVADVTTHSPQAYRLYLEALENLDKLYYPEAEESFKKTLEFDSSFAMAYYGLALIQNINLNNVEAKKSIAKAVLYIDKVSQKEKHYIRSLEALQSSRNYPQAIQELEQIIERYPQEKEAFSVLGTIYYYILRQPEKGIPYYTKVIEIDPLSKLAYNNLAYAYDEIGDFEKSIWAINKYISLAPDEANPYDSRGDLYAWNGRIEPAIESYRKALEKKPDFYASLEKLGQMYLFERDYVRAESCFQELCSGNAKDYRASGRANLALIPLYQGKFEEALKVLERGIEADKLERYEGVALRLKLSLKMQSHGAMRNLEMELAAAEKWMQFIRKINPNSPEYGRDYYIQLLTERGNLKQAQEIAKELKYDIEKIDTTQMPSYWSGVGCIERAKGNLEAAIANFEKAGFSSNNPLSFRIRYELARTYLQAGRLAEAISGFEKLLSIYDGFRAIRAILTVKAHYFLGLAYEKSGSRQKAIQKYEEFLEIWKNADPGIAEVEEAKKKLQELKKGA